MTPNSIGAIVLAAGQSTRMGLPKMGLPWGATTVIGQVVSVLLTAEIWPVIVVSGAAETVVKNTLSEVAVIIAHNERYQTGEMLGSLQTGLRLLSEATSAALVVLGDQPQIEVATVRRLVGLYQERRPDLLVPSHKMRRGHPWLVSRCYWPEILALAPPQNMRDFLNRQASNIHYVEVDNPSILKDLDTPEDYAAERPVQD